MGISSDGMLVFGFEVSGEDEPPKWLQEYDGEDGIDSMFAHFAADKAGVVLNGYKEERAFVETLPAELVMHCSYDYPMYILAVKGFQHSANRGYAVAMDNGKLAVPPKKIAEFKAWCEKCGIPYEEPKWLLCSLYG